MDRLRSLPRTPPSRSDQELAYADLRTPDLFLCKQEYFALLAECDLTVFDVVVQEMPDALAPGVADYRTVIQPRLNPDVVGFYRAFRTRARKEGIPIYLAWADTQAGAIYHGHYKDRLSERHWEALTRLGEEVAATQSHFVRHLGLGVWATRDRLRSRSNTSYVS